ncbi:small heat shock protein, chloroplastic-like protein isoform X2 [Cinnamomum micranthum f. kanehirae]|uniref:Small heat shock protein, chloroplastic-like protein isoform X2 n=1 Tax=Cinnamomum micranthum f. kanehirae TaxID=337451 RepID=A0A443Q4K8_9MAGN|nr:small heat shock protein, chloroplastic-like protein isoform X2 [Cinnamomum micranthum f. kanehirae]
MAAMLASRKAFSSSLMQKLITPCRPLATASSTIRSFNTNVQVSDQGGHDDSLDIDRRSERSISRRGGRNDFIVSDVLDPFFPSRSLSQVLNLMDQMMENPFAALSIGMGGGSRRGFDVREDKDALYLRVDMPGLGKEDVKVFVEQNTLIIKGEGGDKESGYDDSDRESGRRYSSRIDVPSELYKLDEIKAEMKNGVLKVLVPKVMEDERKDVFQVNVES